MKEEGIPHSLILRWFRSCQRWTGIDSFDNLLRDSSNTDLLHKDLIQAVKAAKCLGEFKRVGCIDFKLLMKVKLIHLPELPISNYASSCSINTNSISYPRFRSFSTITYNGFHKILSEIDII